MATKIENGNCESEISTEILNVEKIENSSNDKTPVPTSLDISNCPKTALTNSKTFKCPMFRTCSESFATVDLVNEHYILMHSHPQVVVQNWVWPEEDRKSSDTSFVCNFSENQNLENLEKLKFSKPFRNRPKFSCSDCPFVGKNKVDTQRHRNKVHLTEKRFKCSQCDYATSLSSSLRQHM